MKDWAGYFKAFRDRPLVPSAILCTSFIGFGALAKSTGFGLFPAVYTTVFVFALPGQVVLIDQMTRGVTLLGAALAVTVTAVRLLPMTVALMPQLRTRNRSAWLDYLAAHFIAVTIWIESARRLPMIPRAMRLPYFLGLGTILVSVSTFGTIVGFFAAGVLSNALAAALLFLTPLYFSLGMISAARSWLDYAPLLLGFSLGPLFFVLAPSVDLLLTGLVGGTIAFILGWRKRAKARSEPVSMTQL